MRPAAFLSAEVRALADRLAAVSIGGVVSFSDLSEAIGADIRSRRYLVAAALRVANRETGAIFSSVRGVGYQRLAASDAEQVGATARRRIRRTANRAVGLISRAVSFTNDLAPAAKRAATAEINALSLVRYLATDQAKSAPAPVDSPQPVAVTAKAILLRFGIALPNAGE